MAEQSPAPMPDADLADAGTRTLVPPPSRSAAGGLAGLMLLLALAAGAAWWWWQRTQTVPQLQAGRPSAAVPPTAPAASTAMPSAEPASGPVASPEPVPAEGPLAAADVASALSALVGAQSAKLLISDDFVRRFVVTVDNLGREHAPPRLWPVQPTPGRFKVIEREGRLYADPDNAVRYTPLVLWAEQIDPRAAAAFYGRLLPLAQAAYEELGYPGQRFHTRLIAVIDQLLATPDAPEMIPVTLVEVKGEVPSERPWLRYEFADPRLEAATAGQKMLLRVGAVNQRRLKAQLRALRAELLGQVPR